MLRGGKHCAASDRGDRHNQWSPIGIAVPAWIGGLRVKTSRRGDGDSRNRSRELSQRLARLYYLQFSTPFTRDNIDRPMPKPPTHNVSTIRGYFEFVDQQRQVANGALWYRGVNAAGHALLPSLYRQRPAKTITELAKLEAALMERFRQRSIPFHNRSLRDDWETLFFMQHYGIPTRLLDWTENPLVALFFAVMYARPTKSGAGGFQTDTAVWVLDPVSWNRHALRHQTYDGGVLSGGDVALGGYRPSPDFAGMNNHPVALYGAHNSQRIVAQRGVFTVFGQNVDPMETAFSKDRFPAESLNKLLISRGNIAEIRKSLLEYGITDSVVFPDLDGLAREIKRQFNFEV